MYVIFSSDLDVRPIYTKIGTRDSQVVMSKLVYFQVHRHVRF